MSKYNLIIMLIVAIAISFAVRELFPKRTTITNVIPQIITEYDTVYVHVPPEIREVVVTDTVNIVLKETFVDTTVIQIPCEPDERPNIHPVLNLRFPEQFGDTALVETFSLRTGKPTQSLLYTPGFLTYLEIGPNPVPRMDFAPFPTYKVSLWDRIKHITIGFGACELRHVF